MCLSILKCCDFTTVKEQLSRRLVTPWNLCPKEIYWLHSKVWRVCRRQSWREKRLVQNYKKKPNFSGAQKDLGAWVEKHCMKWVWEGSSFGDLCRWYKKLPLVEGLNLSKSRISWSHKVPSVSLLPWVIIIICYDLLTKATKNTQINMKKGKKRENVQ